MYEYKQPIKNVSYDTIIPELRKVKQLTNNRKLTARNLRTNNYNCWGFTAFVFQWLPDLQWFEDCEMEYCLGTFTRKVKNPKLGDIVVFRNSYGEIEHTAILTDLTTNTILHKPGYLNLEVNTIDEAKIIYQEDLEEVYFARPLKNKKFNFKTFCKSPYNEEYDCYGERWDEDLDC